MTTFALDTSALVAWVLQERGRWRAVDNLIHQPGAQPVLPGPVLTETLATVWRKGNVSSARQLSVTFWAMGMYVEPSVEVDLLRASELLRGESELSLGDALILATTERLDVPIVTLDRYWESAATIARVVIL